MACLMINKSPDKQRLLVYLICALMEVMGFQTDKDNCVSSGKTSPTMV